MLSREPLSEYHECGIYAIDSLRIVTSISNTACLVSFFFRFFTNTSCSLSGAMPAVSGTLLSRLVGNGSKVSVSSQYVSRKQTYRHITHILLRQRSRGL